MTNGKDIASDNISGAGNTVVQGAAQAVIARPVAAAYARRDQNSTRKSMAETEKEITINQQQGQ